MHHLVKGPSFGEALGCACLPAVRGLWHCRRVGGSRRNKAGTNA